MVWVPPSLETNIVDLVRERGGRVALSRLRKDREMMASLGLMKRLSGSKVDENGQI